MGHGWPICELHPESQLSQHGCDIVGEALLGSFLVLQKGPRPSVRELTLINRRDSDTKSLCDLAAL